MEWFYDLSLFEKVYLILSTFGSLILVVILILIFVGGEIDADVDVDGDGSLDGGAGFQFFTFKNLVGFIIIFGWTGIGSVLSGMGTFAVVSISVVCGLIMMFLISLLFYAISGMVEEGTMKMSNAIGRTGEVYLPISPKNGGFGKVQINIQGSIHELQAFTNDDSELKVGTIVRFEKVIDDRILLVTSKLN